MLLRNSNTLLEKVDGSSSSASYYTVGVGSQYNMAIRMILNEGTGKGSGSIRVEPKTGYKLKQKDHELLFSLGLHFSGGAHFSVHVNGGCAYVRMFIGGVLLALAPQFSDVVGLIELSEVSKGWVQS